MFFRSDRNCDFCGTKEIIIRDESMTMFKCIRCGTIHGILPNNKWCKMESPCYKCEYRSPNCHSNCSAYSLFEQNNKEKYKLKARKFDVDTYVGDEIYKNNKRIGRW